MSDIGGFIGGSFFIFNIPLYIVYVKRKKEM